MLQAACHQSIHPLHHAGSVMYVVIATHASQNPVACGGTCADKSLACCIMASCHDSSCSCQLCTGSSKPFPYTFDRASLQASRFIVCSNASQIWHASCQHAVLQATCHQSMHLPHCSELCDVCHDSYTCITELCGMRVGMCWQVACMMHAALMPQYLKPILVLH